MLNGVTNLVCEVVPRHIAGQQRLLGFKQIAGPKPCKRVDVPDAVLLQMRYYYIGNHHERVD
jgi:hypothetical protein